jgi:hypothetical protein
VLCEGTVNKMNITDVSHVDDIIYKHLHRSNMNEVCNQIKTNRSSKFWNFYNEEIGYLVDEYELHYVPDEELYDLVEYYIDHLEIQNSCLITCFATHTYSQEEAIEKIAEMQLAADWNDGIFESVHHIPNTGFYLFQ